MSYPSMFVRPLGKGRHGYELTQRRERALNIEREDSYRDAVKELDFSSHPAYALGEIDVEQDTDE